MGRTAGAGLHFARLDSKSATPARRFILTD
jgi:hypothetical protein